MLHSQSRAGRVTTELEELYAAMRVCMVSPFYPYEGDKRYKGAHYGGVERVIAQVAAGLSARDVNVTVVTTAAVPHQRVEKNVTIVAVRRLAVVFRNPIAWVLPAVMCVDTDVLHVPATYPGFSDLVLVAAKLRRIPSVLDLHFEPVFADPLASMFTRLYMHTGARMFRHYDRIIVHSPSYVKQLEVLRGVPADKISYIPLGVDCERFRPLARRPRNKRPTALFVGRLVPYKGVEVLLDAWVDVQAQARDAQLLIVGSGPLEGQLRRQAQQLDVNARFLGYIEDKELPLLYQSADLTVLPSVNRQEAFGLSLLESMACGTPVVASNIPGVKDIAAIAGRLAPPGDRKGLAKAMVDVLGDASIPRGEVLHDLIAQRFSWHQIVHETIALYRSVIADAARGKTQR